MKSPRAARSALRLQDYGLNPGTLVVLYLHTPKEKIWGFLVSTMAAGVVIRGMDLPAFEDWMRQEARGEDPLLGPSTVFYPMTRVERMEKDETIGPIPSYAERFSREVGRTVHAALGVPAEADLAEDE
ncbi:MAG TPA: hypothetical protein VFO85_09985 [Vicinamibacteria bacterium]|nr:hypothetical protein [Vicinamibacteria bacterium]